MIDRPLKGTESGKGPLLAVFDLKKHFPVKSGVFRRTTGRVHAVDGVSFHIERGETLGLVGESGCGKSTIGKCILRLLQPTGGRIVFDGEDVGKMHGGKLKDYRRKVQAIFQDPYSSLNPRMSVENIVGEPLKIYGICSRAERRERVRDLLERVGLRPDNMFRYPHEFSGGQRQRIGIARALALQPHLIVCDEPVSALDVSVQAQVINRLDDLKAEFHLSYLFIAHDLSVVEHISDRIAVMYLGKLVELAKDTELCARPLHPYSSALVSAIPVPEPSWKKSRMVLAGEVPSPIHPPAGCRFHPRCPRRKPVCSEAEPDLKKVAPDHWVACHQE